MTSPSRNATVIAAPLLAIMTLAQTACVKRSFNTISQTRNELQPLSAQEFEDALYSGAREAVGFYSKAELEAFFDEVAIESLKNSQKQRFLDAIAYQFPLVWSLSRVNLTPVWLSRAGTGNIPKGGLVLLGRDLFPEGFYRQQGASLPLSALMTQAPWFEWDQAHKIFHPRRGGSPERILKGLFQLRGEADGFTLYRGAGTQMNVFAPATRNPYESGQPEAGEVMFFSSPSLNTALAWASPAVWKAEVPRRELLAGVAGQQPTIYVGFEYHYPEIAFLRTKKAPPALLASKRSELLCVSSEKLKFMADNPRASDSKVDPSLEKCNPKWLGAHLSGFPDPVVELKKAVLKSDAKIKSVPVRDDRLEEGSFTCQLKQGMEIEYSLAYEATEKQVWIHSRGISAAWNCPRGFSSTHFYVDSEKISLTLSE